MDSYIVPLGEGNFSPTPAYENALAQLNVSADALPAVITTAEDAAKAQAVLATVAGIRKLLDKAHADVKAPYLAACRNIDAIKKTETAKLDAIKARINDAIVAYQRAEQEKLRKAQEEAARKAAEIEAAAEAERAKLDPALQCAHAAATDIVVAQETRAIVESAGAAPVAGMRIVRSVKILSVDISALLRARFDLCKVEANLPAIKKEILAGKQIPGIVAQIVESASARAAAVNPADFDY